MPSNIREDEMVKKRLNQSKYDAENKTELGKGKFVRYGGS